MARTVWLTFWGEFRGHGDPHESPRLITAPLIALSAMAVVGGWLSIPHWFGEFTANPVAIAAHAPEYAFNWGYAAASFVIAAAGLAVGWLYYQRHSFAFFHGLTARSQPAHAGYAFLENKYYLDVLYTDMIVGSIKGPIARATYWFDQHVIDAVVNAVGIGARSAGDWMYDYVDQKVVDGAVNGTGFVAEGGGRALRTLQTGKIQQYALAFFGVGVVIAGVGLLAYTHAF
jgi:NADH-quinone oxidoreductase subunit L